MCPIGPRSTRVVADRGSRPPDHDQGVAGQLVYANCERPELSDRPPTNPIYRRSGFPITQSRSR
eukprot:3605892-Lingulodinium_polyedra.AAC.1